MTNKWILGLGMGVLVAFAAVPALSDNSAVVVKDTACNLYDGNGNLTLADGSVEVSNHGGVTVFVCKAKGLANDTGTAVQFDNASTGLPCLTDGGATDDWHDTVSASGNSTLVCRINN
jgi:hypothetical protein